MGQVIQQPRWEDKPLETMSLLVPIPCTPGPLLGILELCLDPLLFGIHLWTFLVSVILFPEFVNIMCYVCGEYRTVLEHFEIVSGEIKEAFRMSYLMGLLSFSPTHHPPGQVISTT